MTLRIIAASPSGATSQPHDDDRSGSSRAGTNSAAGCGGEKTRRPSNVDLERLYASYADDRPDLYRDLDNETEGAAELLAQWRESFDADLRIIGIGLAAGVFFSVILRLAQMGWLS